MKISIRHELVLPALELPGRSVQHLLLTPPTGETQKVSEWTIEGDGIAEAASFIDGFGNRAHLVNQSRRDGPLSLVAQGVIETHDRHGVVGRTTGEPVPSLFLRVTPLTSSPAQAHLPPAGRIAFLHALMAEVGEQLAPDAPAQTQTQSQSQSQTQSQGQTQSQSQSQEDRPEASGEAPKTGSGEAHAHLFIARARAAGIPARFVTGYVADEDGESGFRCWAEAFDRGLGWIGFDPLLGYCPTEWHVRLAIGLDASGTTPIRAVPGLSTSPSGDVAVDIIAASGQ